MPPPRRIIRRSDGSCAIRTRAPRTGCFFSSSTRPAIEAAGVSAIATLPGAAADAATFGARDVRYPGRDASTL